MLSIYLNNALYIMYNDNTTNNNNKTSRSADE